MLVPAAEADPTLARPLLQLMVQVAVGLPPTLLSRCCARLAAALSDAAQAGDHALWTYLAGLAPDAATREQLTRRAEAVAAACGPPPSADAPGPDGTSVDAPASDAAQSGALTPRSAPGSTDYVPGPDGSSEWRGHSGGSGSGGWAVPGSDHSAAQPDDQAAAWD